jgi:type IV pilus assembly protein PilY1
MSNMFKTCLIHLFATILSLQVSTALAEDIDIFTGDSGGSSANPNVLIVLDNSSNWSANNQGWPTDANPPVPCGNDCNKQGYYELKAIRTVLQRLQTNSNNANGDISVNLGLMMFNNSNATRDGGYIRSAIKPMTAANLTAFIGKIDTIIQNFNTETAASSVQYGAVLFDVFKYFGGYTETKFASSNQGPSANPSYSGINVFGTTFWGSNNADGTKPDTTAYSGSNYVPPDQSTCGRNYVIFIGNGFPAKDDVNSSDMGQVLKYLTNPSNPPSSITEFKVPTYSCAGTWTNMTPSTCYADTEACNAAKPADLVGGTTSNALYQCANSSCRGNQRLVQQCTSIATTYSTPSSNAAGRYGDEFASFLANTDVSNTTGQQNITMFTIDVYKDQPSVDQSGLLRNMATYGKGAYLSATNVDAIAIAIENAFNNILAVNSTFASASLPVNSTNRAQNENQVYIGMFRPDADRKPRWFGNLKRYQIVKIDNQIELGDQNGALAVSPTTGFIQDSAVSYWTTDSPLNPNDLSQGYYWDPRNVSVTPSPANPTVTGDARFSDTPDGPVVEKGSVAELLRKGSGNWTPSRTIKTTTSAFSTALTDIGTSTTLNETQRKWVTGLNTEAEAIVLSATQSRPSIHGDVVHSRPLPVTYGVGDTVVYYGSNEGMFRAINAQNGSEMWAFMPFEFAQSAFVDRLRDNSPLIKFSNDTSVAAASYKPKPYGWDGSIGIAQNLDNTKVWIYPTMRRGGKMVYALDVTNKNSPIIKWKHGCYEDTCTSEFSNMGQSWSTPVVAPVAGYTTEKVAIFGGGYDTCEDADNASPSCSSPRGANVYVVDAGSGNFLKKFSTDRSVVADVSLVDINSDGKADYAYAADTGGNLYRIDMVTRTVSGTSVTYTALTPGNWTMRKIATANSSSSGSRKFFYQPALFPVAKYGKVYVAIGSGDREHPLYSNYTREVTNRFYVYLDDLSGTSGSAIDLNTLVDRTTDLGCESPSITPTSTASGWYIDLSTGEQTVTSALILAGQVIFSTNKAVSPEAGSCSTGLGEARGYWMNLLNASGTIDQNDPGVCGGDRSSKFVSDGMPPSPVVGTVLIDGKPETVVIGAVDQSKGVSTAISPNKVVPAVQPVRTRIYHKVKGID